MRFLIDMNLSPRWVEFLTAAGHDAIHWSTVGAPNACDRELLEHAVAERRVLMTQDLDFGTILAVGGLEGPSVIQFRSQAVLPESVGPSLLSAVAAAQEHLIAGALVTVDTNGHRVNVLPIKGVATPVANRYVPLVVPCQPASGAEAGRSRRRAQGSGYRALRPDQRRDRWPQP